MLDHQKLVAQLDKISKDLCLQFAHQKDIAWRVWQSIASDVHLADKIKSKKWPFLVPHWQGLLSKPYAVDIVSMPYAVLAVDGSQIYYDKHQGPACYLINIGSVLLSYGLVKSSVNFASQPFVIIGSAKQPGTQSAESVNAQREQFELQVAVVESGAYQSMNPDIPFVCLFDGTLIFSEGSAGDGQDSMVQQYLMHLNKMYELQILHVGYISFTRSKELVNVLKVVAAAYEDNHLDSATVLDGLTDMDIVPYFLQAGQRSIIFQSKAPVTYLYAKHLKPYFCYLHVGFEIVRLEFPYWIASNEQHVNIICQIALDQAKKGQGYPVCLFEAHEQAVVKSMDRDFFYLMIQKMTQKYDGSYKKSYKSMKKLQVPI